MDPVLAAVESLRAAFPPDAEAADRHPRRREAALASLLTLAQALSAPDAPPLLPLQFEVLFRQLTHLLLVMRAWEASGTAEECLRAVLDCIDALLRSPLAAAADAALLLSGARLREVTGQALSELLLAAAAQRSVPLSAACLGALSRVCRPPASAAGLAPDVLGFFLPGVVSRTLTLTLALTLTLTLPLPPPLPLPLTRRGWARSARTRPLRATRCAPSCARRGSP